MGRILIFYSHYFGSFHSSIFIGRTRYSPSPYHALNRYPNVGSIINSTGLVASRNDTRTHNSQRFCTILRVAHMRCERLWWASVILAASSNCIVSGSYCSAKSQVCYPGTASARSSEVADRASSLKPSILNAEVSGAVACLLFVARPFLSATAPSVAPSTPGEQGLR